MDFKEWLATCKKTNGEDLSLRTVDHYYNGLNTISKEMTENHIIDKPLSEMSMVELDLAIAIIFSDVNFCAKDKKGNKMYSNALKKFRCYNYLNSDSSQTAKEEERIINKDKSLTVTERESLIKSRIGQGDFRKRLLLKYNHECIVCGSNIEQILIASHIKPWAVCSNTERLDVDNGLILGATYDRLFDGGLITFEPNGKLVPSVFIDPKNAQLLHLDLGKKYDLKCTDQMKGYLQYHNEHLFVGN